MNYKGNDRSLNQPSQLIVDGPAFNFEYLVLGELEKLANKNGTCRLKDAYLRLGRLYHLRKQQSRVLLISMSKAGYFRFRGGWVIVDNPRTPILEVDHD